MPGMKNCQGPTFPVNGTVSRTLSGANVPGCQRSVTFPQFSQAMTPPPYGGARVQVSYAPGECVVDHLYLNPFTENVSVDTIVLCAACLPNALTQM